MENRPGLVTRWLRMATAGVVLLSGVLAAAPASEPAPAVPLHTLPTQEECLANHTRATQFTRWLELQLEVRVHPDSWRFEAYLSYQREVVEWVWWRLFCLRREDPQGSHDAWHAGKLAELVGWKVVEAGRWPEPAPAWFDPKHHLPPPPRPCQPDTISVFAINLQEGWVPWRRP